MLGAWWRTMQVISLMITHLLWEECLWSSLNIWFRSKFVLFWTYRQSFYDSKLILEVLEESNLLDSSSSSICDKLSLSDSLAAWALELLLQSDFAWTCPHTPQPLARNNPILINQISITEESVIFWLLFLCHLMLPSLQVVECPSVSVSELSDWGLMICTWGKNGWLRICLHGFHMLILLILCISQ